MAEASVIDERPAIAEFQNIIFCLDAPTEFNACAKTTVDTDGGYPRQKFGFFLIRGEYFKRCEGRDRCRLTDSRGIDEDGNAFFCGDLACKASHVKGDFKLQIDGIGQTQEGLLHVGARKIITCPGILKGAGCAVSLGNVKIKTRVGGLVNGNEPRIHAAFRVKSHQPLPVIVCTETRAKGNVSAEAGDRNRRKRSLSPGQKIVGEVAEKRFLG